MASRREYEMLFSLNAQLGGGYNSTFKSAQGSIASMQNEIAALNKTQSDISSYQKQQSAVEATAKKLDVLRQQHDNLQREQKETGDTSADTANKLLSQELQIQKTSTALDTQTAKLNQLGTALRGAGVDTNNLTGESAKLGSQVDAIKDKQEAAADKASNFGTTASQAFGAVQQAIVAAGLTKLLQEIYEGIKSCIDASVEFESAMTGVAKTTDFSDTELAAMSQSLKDMSTEIPETTTQLGEIAETAGQLGIAKEDLLDFTEIMAELGTATNMTSGDAATMLAQFSSITGMDPSYYSNLGSAIVDLGNSYATTERNVTEMSQSIAASGSIAGMSEADILAVAAAVTSLGFDASMGGTQINKLITDINSAVASGEDITKWASAASMSADDFSAAWGDDAANALNLFIQGLNDTYTSGGNLYGVLSDLGITETRMVSVISSLAKSGDRLTDTLDTANTAWAENTALTTEAEKRYATTQSLLTLMKNSYTNLKVAVGDVYTPALRELYEAEANVLDGMTEFVGNNPELVRAGTAFIAVVGTATVALTGYAAIVKIVKALELATVFTGPTAAIIAVVAGVAALTAGFAAMAAEAEDEATPSVKELTEAARETSDAMKEASGTYYDTVASTQAAANVADSYIGKLEAMEAAGITTDEQAQQYHNTLVLLCQVVPALSDYIDLETDIIDGGTAALWENTEAWKENAKQRAYQDELEAVTASQAAVLVEQEKNSIKLTEAQYKLESATKKFNWEAARTKQLLFEAEEEAQAYYETTGNLANVSDFLTDEYWDLQDALGSSSEEMKAAQSAANTYAEAVEDGRVAAEDAQAQIDLTQKAIENLTGATEEETAAAQESAAQEQELQTAIAKVTAQVDALTESYNAAYAAAYDSIQGQYSLWDEAASVVATSAGTINSNIESQITYWQQYNDSLAGLSERSADIEGLSDMIASFADGSADSVNAIAGMAGASDEDLSAMVQNWQELQEEQKNAAGSLADLETDFSSSMDALKKTLTDTVSEMDLGEEAAQSGMDTIQGFVDAAADMLPDVQAAYKELAAAANRALGSTSFTVSVTPSASGIEHNARGTTNAAEVFIAGEEGPELIVGKGGSTVYTADETRMMMEAGSESAQLIAIDSQLMSYLAARGNTNEEAVSAQYGGGGGNNIVLKMNPQYNITGAVNSSELEVMLRSHDENLIDEILDRLESAGIDAKRRAY